MQFVPARRPIATMSATRVRSENAVCGSAGALGKSGENSAFVNSRGIVDRCAVELQPFVSNLARPVETARPSNYRSCGRASCDRPRQLYLAAEAALCLFSVQLCSPQSHLSDGQAE